MSRTQRNTGRGNSAVRQRGAVAVFVAISMVALIAAIALAIDIGQLYYAQRDLQRLATLSALSAAQIASGCADNAGMPSSLAATSTEVQSVLVANNGSTAMMTGINGSPAVELGVVENASNGSGLRGFKPLTEGDPNINAVRVNLTTPTPALLVPFIGGSVTGTTLYASATAQQAAAAGFSVGSGGAALSGGLLNTLLTGLLGSNVNLSLASYTGLANANVSLGNLLTGATSLGLGVNDLSDLLNLNLTLPQALGVLGNALSSATTTTGGSVSSGVSGAVLGLAGTALNNGSTFTLGSILNTTGLSLNPTVSNVVQNVPFIDGLSLLTALGEAAAANSNGGIVPIALPVGVTVPSVLSVNAFIKVLSPPQFAFGPVGVSASTAQATVMLRISGGSLLSTLTSSINSAINGLLGTLGGVLGLTVNITIPTSLNIGADVAAAPSTATLTRLQCPSTSNPSPIASLTATSGVASVNVGTFSGSASAAPALSGGNTFPLATVSLDATHACIGVSVRGVCIGIPANLGSTTLNLGLQLTSLGVSANGPIPLNNVTDFTPVANPSPPYNYNYTAVQAPATPNESPQTIGSPTSVSLNLGVTSSQTGSGLTGALGSLVNGLVTSITNTVLPAVLGLVNSLATAVVNPLLQTLGIQLGTATVTTDGVAVYQPVLMTTCLPGTAPGAGLRGCPAVP